MFYNVTQNNMEREINEYFVFYETSEHLSLHLFELLHSKPSQMPINKWKYETRKINENIKSEIWKVKEFE